MRRRRRDDDSESSLELLLDTMCNAFGGIIFIAMLLSVLSLTGSAAKNAASVSEVVEDPAARQLEEMSVQAEVEELNAEIEKAKETTEQQKKNIALLVKEADIPLLARLASLEVDAERMDEEFRQILQLMTAEEAEWEKALRENPDLSGEIKAKEEELRKARDELNNTVAAKEKERDKVEGELEAEKKKRQRKVKLPRIHKSDKDPFWVILKGGRLYFVQEINSSGNASGWNTAEISVVEHKYSADISIRSGAGQRVQPGADKTGNLRQLRQKLNKSRWFVHIAVYPDSYSEFHTLREILLNHGFGYHCVIMKKEEVLSLFRAPPGSFEEQ